MKSYRRERGFTLIELLVVVAIIALLISILLPSLSRAREQAKIVKCMSNLKNIQSGCNQYNLEFDDYPWTIPNTSVPGGAPPYGGFQLISELVYGGGMPSKTTQDFQANGLMAPPYGYPAPAAWDVYRVPPRLRPLNRYVAPSVTWDAEPASPAGGPRQTPTEIPEFFKDPSDSHAFVPTVGANNPIIESDTPITSWEFYGNSYAINWYWPYYYQRSGPTNGVEVGFGGPYGPWGQFGALIGTDEGRPGPTGRRGAGRKMLRNKDGRFASEFVVTYEENLNYALEAAKPPGYSGAPWAAGPGKRLLGWHRQQDRHAASYLDGSARYQTMDTRYVYGQGWTIWPNKPWTGLWSTYNDGVPGNP